MENSKRPHYLGHRDRLKERFIAAPDGFTDAELIELMLGYVIRGRDVKPQAKLILSEAKQLGNIFESNIKSVRGVGKETALFFEALREFINRMDYQKIAKKPLDLSSSGSVFKFLKTKIGYSNKEVFIILFLDIKNRLMSFRVIREGFINSVAISAREIIEHAIANGATSVIISHNHPSGDSTPSDSDLSTTRQICRALKYTGVTLLDHIVVSFHEYYSMSAHGYIKKFYDEIK